MNHISLTNRPQLIPDLSCARAIGRWGLLSHTRNAVRWLALTKRSVAGAQLYTIYILTVQV